MNVEGGMVEEWMWKVEILNIFFDLCTAMSETEEMTPCPNINPLSIQAQEKK